MSYLVRDIMTKKVITIEPSNTVLEAARIMGEKKIGSLVVKRNDKAVGIITERGIIRRVVAKNLDPAKITVEDVMSKPLITANPDISVREAVRLMVKNKIRRLPIVKDTDLVGIVTSTDLAKYLGKRKQVLGLVFPLEEAPEVSESQKPCRFFKADPYLPKDQIWDVCGACYWFMQDRCLREALGMVKKLPIMEAEG